MSAQLIFLFIGFVGFTFAEFNRNEGDDREAFYLTLKIIFWTFAAVFVPVILSFIYSVAVDPLTPQLIKSLIEYVKKKGMGYLGNKQTSKVKQTTTKGQ